MDDFPAMFNSSPNRTQRRAKPRTPLQERSQSQTNEESARLGKEPRREETGQYIFSATPFPTKPQHILLPSTVRKQKSFRDGENQIQNLFVRGQQGASSRPTTAGQSENGQEDSRGRKRAPVLQLKRSVSTLRDMYEAQAERSRPSTAASYGLRPGTASSRLRSASSSEGFAGRNAWEELHKISADDMALLPALSRSSIEKLASESSFATRAGQHNPLTSTPNYRTYATSSPRIPIFQDNPTSSSDNHRQSSSSNMQFTSSSSPNFVRLGRSSSIAETLNTEQSSSSPIFVKLGTSSPGFRRDKSPTPSNASTESRKRKRDDADTGRSLAARSSTFSSSPPYVVLAPSSSEPSLKSPDAVLPSSPPQPESAHSQSIATSSPVYRLPGPGRNVSNSSSSASTHESLQYALSSSPMPPIQYPVIRAPIAVASSLNVPKRTTRSSSTINEGQWISRLSPVPSEWDEGLSRAGSKRSRHIHELEGEVERSDLVIPELEGNESQVHIIPIIEEDHTHEATDELRALPRRGHISYRSPPLVPQRTNSLFGTNVSSSASLSQSRLDSLRTSIDTRLNSMRSFAHSRQNSFMSSINRPSSSGSQSANIAVPTWARRYYSGLYADSFHYLYPSQGNSAANIPAPLRNDDLNRTSSMTSGLTPRNASVTASRHSARSWQSIRNTFRNSIMEFVPSIVIPKNRPRMEARKSHLMAGVGPLVSNPVSPEMVQTRLDPHGPNPTIRRVSDRLPAADPRAHWAGITDEQRSIMQYQSSSPYHNSQQFNRQSTESSSYYYDAISGQVLPRSRFTDIPNLHHDRRLNTGSSISRGFGFPFNRKSRYEAPSVYDAGTHPSWFRIDLRDAQVTCFIIGFVVPLAWFAGAFLPLPRRPDSFDDIEKTLYEQQVNQAGQNQDMDIVARLRLERHIKGIEELRWQNARWWKRMNKWMCLVGMVVFVLIIILAIIGTRNHW